MKKRILLTLAIALGLLSVLLPVRQAAHAQGNTPKYFDPPFVFQAAGPTTDHGRTSTMAVARVSEISATSSSCFEDAIRQGLERATRTLRGVTSAWIKDQRVKLRDGQVTEYQVNMEVTFVLEG